MSKVRVRATPEDVFTEGVCDICEEYEDKLHYYALGSKGKYFCRPCISIIVRQFMEYLK